MKTFSTIFAVLWAFTATSTSTASSLDSTQFLRFEHLDDWSLMNILDFLDFGDLAVLSKLSPRYHQLIFDHYIPEKYHFHGANMYFSITWGAKKPFVYHLVNGDFSKTNEIASGYDGVQFILQFCPIFGKMAIRGDRFDNEYIQNITGMANRCPDTPQRIDFDLQSIDDVDFTFEYATEIDLKWMEKYNATAINRMFPRMESLAIYAFHEYQLDYQFPHLTSFELKEFEYGRFDLKSFGRLNPQIRRLKYELIYKLERLQEVNEIFPDLEVLHVKLDREDVDKKARQSSSQSVVSKITSKWTSIVEDLFKIPTKTIESIHFKNVRHLTLDIDFLYYNGCIPNPEEHTIDSWPQDRLAAMRFDRLETFTYYSRHTEFMAEQIDMITQNSDLIEVNFSSTILSYEQMRRLVDALPKLQKVTLYCAYTDIFSDIVKLMQETTLKRIAVLAYSDSKKQLMQDAYVLREWELEKIGGDVMTFVRREA